MVGRHRNPTAASLLKQQLRYDLAKLVLLTEKQVAFETDAQAVDERDERVRRLSSSVIPAARKLATKLTCDDGEEPPSSLADPCYMRLSRRVNGSQLLVSIRDARAAGMQVKAFTLVWPEHAVEAAALLGLKPKRLTEWLRRLILKHLPCDSSGWLYAQLHGEYEARSNTFVIHFHGIAAGDYLATLDGPVRDELKVLLEELLKGKLNTLPRNPTAPKVRVVLKFAYLRDAPRQVSYVLQSWWPSRPIVMKRHARSRTRRQGTTSACQKVVTRPPRLERVRTKQRIPEPHHSAYLVWLDRQSISGLRLRMGLGSGG